MDFDKAAYRASKARVIGLIKQTHDWENTEGFISDGVVCPDIYEKQALRILCVLAESYGYDECRDDRDIERQGKEDFMGVGAARVRTPKTLPSLLWLIQESFQKARPLEWEEFPWFFSVTQENTKMLQEALSKVAWINVKKASRSEGTLMDSEEVYRHALQNREILKEQIESTVPDLIIVCGDPVFRALHDMKLLGEGIQLGRKGCVQTTPNGCRVLEIPHPSPRNPDWRSYEGVYENFTNIFQQLNRARS